MVKTYVDFQVRSDLRGRLKTDATLAAHEAVDDRLRITTSLGNRILRLAAAGKRIYFEYDAADDLRIIQHSANRVGSAWQNEFDTNLVYDEASRVTSITHDLATDIVHAYGYDNQSRVTSFNTTGTGAASRGYGYDNASQLTSKTGTGAESYTYDDNGNRTLVGSQGIATGLGNRMLGDGTYSYAYDQEGNLVRRTPLSTPSSGNPVTVYGYDQRNRLTGLWQFASVADADGFQNWVQSITYTYDLAGRRVKRALDTNGAAVGGVSNEYFVYDGDELALSFNNSQQLEHRYLHGPADQVLVDEVFNAAGQSTERLWLLADQQGSVRDVVSDTGTLRKHVDYDSFGKVTAEQTFGAAVEQVFYYTGQERDGATGLYNIGVRWYDPWTGRWLTEDPIGLAGGDANFYRYVHNNPVIYVDPSGLRQQGNPLDSLFGNHNARVPVPTSLLSQPSLFGNRAASLPSLQTSVSSSFLGQSINNLPWHSETVAASVSRSPVSAPRAAVMTAKAPAVRPPASTPTPVSSGLLGTIGGYLRIAASFAYDTVSNYPSFLKTELSTAGRSIVETGRSTGEFVGNHASGLYYDPWNELEQARQARDAIAVGVYNTTSYVAQHPFDAATRTGRAAINYVDRLTSDPTVSGELVGQSAVAWATGGATAAGKQAVAYGLTTFRNVSTVADNIVIDAYSNLTRRVDLPGQAHHLNQNAAFGGVIPQAEGVAIRLQGNAFFDVGSPHYTTHSGLEAFLDEYRRGGSAFPARPIISDYNRALYNGLQEAGLLPSQALRAVRAAKGQQLEFGLHGFDPLPEIPGRLNQVPRP